MPYPESKKSKSDAARKPAPASPGLDFLHALAYVPLPGRTRRKRRGVWVLAALIGAGSMAAATIYFRPMASPEELPKINSVVIDHYNPFIRASGVPHLQSDKVQFINGVYTVVPNSRATDGTAEARTSPPR
jgi:hypothetical protein